VLTPENRNIIRAYHDSILVESDSLVNAWSDLNKSAASMKLIRYFSKALRVPGSYQYSFDSLSSIAILEPEDKLFRIFTWQLAYDNGTHRYYGVIQTNAPQPVLFPLVDYGTLYQHPDSIIVDHDRWIGALYYKIIPVKSGKTTYYTLFGWNGGNVLSNKKIIDVLWWDGEGKPRFGYPLFDMLKGKSPTRVILEYKDDASLSLSYIPEEQSIYYDHLVPLSGKQGDFKFDYVPDGTLEGFIWKKGKWKQLEIIDYEKRQDGQVPNVIKEQKQPLYRPLPPR
jgi:hypothetical protein